MQLAVDQEVLVGRQFLVQVDFLGGDADQPLDLHGLAHHVKTGDGGGAPGGPGKPGEDLDEGSLAGAVGPQEPEDLAVIDAEIHLIQGDDVPIVLAQVLNGNHDLGWSSSFIFRG